MSIKNPLSVICQRRAALGLSQYDLASRAGVHPATVSNAERFGFASLRTAEKLATVLGCKPEDLREVPLAPVHE